MEMNYRLVSRYIDFCGIFAFLLFFFINFSMKHVFGELTMDVLNEAKYTMSRAETFSIANTTENKLHLVFLGKSNRTIS